MSAERKLITALAVAAVVAVAIAVGGCSGREVPAAPAGPSTPDRDDVVSSGPMSPGTTTPSDPPANEVVPEPAKNLVAVPWQRAEPVAGRAELLVHGTLRGGPPCAVVSRVDVAEAADAVTVTVWVGSRPGAACDGPRPELAYHYVTSVTLDAPLAGRAVEDGA